jgi:hypothetical protein
LRIQEMAPLPGGEYHEHALPFELRRRVDPHRRDPE